MAGLLAASFVLGALDVVLTQSTYVDAYNFGATVVITAVVFCWYRLDAIERGYRPGWLMSIAVVALAAVAIPIYFFRSRGFKGGVRAAFLFMLFLIACLSMAIVGGATAESGLMR